MAGLAPGSKLLISTPQEFDDYIRTIPAGSSTSISEIRAELAKRHGADVTCALTAGIFLRILAEAAYEDMLAGKPVADITPFWRAIDLKTKTAAKLTFGTEFLTKMRVSEGLQP